MPDCHIHSDDLDEPISESDVFAALKTEAARPAPPEPVATIEERGGRELEVLSEPTPRGPSRGRVRVEPSDVSGSRPDPERERASAAKRQLSSPDLTPEQRRELEREIARRTTRSHQRWLARTHGVGPLVRRPPRLRPRARGAGRPARRVRARRTPCARRCANASRTSGSDPPSGDPEPGEPAATDEDEGGQS